MDASSLKKAAEKAKAKVVGVEQASKKETPAQKEARLAKEKVEKAKKASIGGAKASLAKLKLQREKLSPAKLKEAKSYMSSFKPEQLKSMLQKSSTMSVLDLQRGGTLRLQYRGEKDPKKKVALKKQLQANQGYAQMTAQFAKEKSTKDGQMYLEVDLKNIDRYENQLGAGHICPYTWKKVSIEDKNGDIQTGYRKVPGVDKGIYGTKIGYYTSSGEYLPVYSGYKIYPLEIKNDPAQLAKEQEFYKKEKKYESQGGGSGGRSSSSSTVEDYESAKKKLEGSDKSKMAIEGRTPFLVKMGYRMTPEERTIYMREYKEARRLSKMSMKERLDLMQQRYKLKDALNLSFRALRLPDKHRKHFMAYNDAVMYIESRYNPICVNRRKGKIALSTATGAYQILNSVWTSTCNKWLRDTKKSRWYKKYYSKKVPPEYQIDFDLENIILNDDDFKGIDLKYIDFNQPLPGLATPFQHAIFHNIYAFKGSRLTKGVMPFDEVFDKLQSDGLSPEMEYSHKAYLYANWRNGHGGAKVILAMMKQGIPFPRNKAEAREYFEQMPNCWQKRRGFGDFSTLVRACRAFVGRFNKNLRE